MGAEKTENAKVTTDGVATLQIREDGHLYGEIAEEGYALGIRDHKYLTVEQTFADYAFYKNKYHGDAIAEADFPKWESRAEDRINFLTFGRITNEVLAEYTNAIGKATCALAEVMYGIGTAIANANDPENGNVKSKSSGGESVSFGATDTVYTEAMADRQKQMILERDAVATYLGDTGLLYAGASGI